MVTSQVRVRVGPPVGEWFRSVVLSVWALLVMAGRATAAGVVAIESSAGDRASRLRHLSAFAMAGVAVVGLAGLWWGLLAGAVLVVLYDWLIDG